MSAEVKVVIVDQAGQTGTPSNAQYAPQTSIPAPQFSDPAAQPKSQFEQKHGFDPFAMARQEIKQFGASAAPESAAGAEAGGGSMAVGAAGVVAVGLSAIGKFADKLGDAALAVGKFGQMLARGDNFNAVAFGVSELADAMKKVPFIGEALGGLLSGVTKVATAIHDTADAFSERGKQLAPFNTELAQAAVEAEMRKFGSQIQEAQTLGPALSELMIKQAEFDARLAEILLPIKKFIIEQLSGFIESMQSWMETIRNFFLEVIEIGKTLADAARDFLKGDFAKSIQDLTEMGDRMAKAIEKPPDEERSTQFNDAMEQLTRFASDAEEHRDAARRMADARIARPAF